MLIYTKPIKLQRKYFIIISIMPHKSVLILQCQREFINIPITLFLKNLE